MPCKVSENEDDFIGKMFGLQDQLTVTGWDGSRKNGDKVYQVFCSICALDPEVFGNGVFQSKRANLIKGIVPCGCSTRYVRSERQAKVLISRLCEARNYNFLGFSNEWAGNDTRLSLECQIDGHKWNPKLADFRFNVKNGCAKCSDRDAGVRKSLSYDDAVNSFMSTGKFLEGTKFTKVAGAVKKRTHWEYTCPVCSNDEYVKAAVCSGVFKSTQGQLSEGHIACRCSNAIRWTKPQRDYQVAKILAAEDSKIKHIGWHEYKGEKHGKLVMYCPIHKGWEVSVDVFLKGTRCPACAKPGYSQNKQGFVYALKIEGLSESFTGFGISNNPDSRLSQHRRILATFGLSITSFEIVATEGVVAPKVESAIKKHFPKSAQTIKGFMREATHYNLFESVVTFIKFKCYEIASTLKLKDTLVPA